MGITDERALEITERDLSVAAAERVVFMPPPYDFNTLKQLHRQLFSDIFTWAGKIRSIDLSKGSTRFCTVSRIEPEAEKLFTALAHKQWLADLSREALVSEIAQFCGDLNMIHPFREGNGRATRIFCEFVIINAGFEIDWQPASQREWLQASIDSVACDYHAMQAVFDTCIGKPLED